MQDMIWTNNQAQREQARKNPSQGDISGGSVRDVPRRRDGRAMAGEEHLAGWAQVSQVRIRRHRPHQEFKMPCRCRGRNKRFSVRTGTITAHSHDNPTTSRTPLWLVLAGPRTLRSAGNTVFTACNRLLDCACGAKCGYLAVLKSQNHSGICGSKRSILCVRR